MGSDHVVDDILRHHVVELDAIAAGARGANHAAGFEKLGLDDNLLAETVEQIEACGSERAAAGG